MESWKMIDHLLDDYPVGYRIEGPQVVIEVEGRYPAQEQRHHVPAYRFHIRRKPSDEIVGNMSLRLGSNEHIENYAGNIGYNVDEAHRGHGFAAQAVILLKEVIKAHEFDGVFITCNPENIASRRTCEKIEAKLLGRVTVPKDNPMYMMGIREKLHFEWRL